MTKYKIETHAHTYPASLCSGVLPKDIVRIYAQNNYSGLVITNHINEGYIPDKTNITAADVDKFMLDFYITEEEGYKCGLKVYFGAEIKFNGRWDDFLVYGIDRDFFLDMPDMFTRDAETVKRYANARGARIFQAHPFRMFMTPANPAHIDGVEGINGNPHANSGNDKALLYAKDNGLVAIAGSDFHHPHYIGSGILSKTLPENGLKLAKLLLSGKFELFERE